MKSAAIIFQFAGDERANKDMRLLRIRILCIRMCNTKRTSLSSAYFTHRMSNRILIKSSSVSLHIPISHFDCRRNYIIGPDVPHDGWDGEFTDPIRIGRSATMGWGKGEEGGGLVGKRDTQRGSVLFVQISLKLSSICTREMEHFKSSALRLPIPTVHSG